MVAILLVLIGYNITDWIGSPVPSVHPTVSNRRSSDSFGQFDHTVQKVLMARIAAGLLMFRVKNDVVQVLLAHPGGPYFQNQDDGVWTIPKGEPDPGEDLLVTARREFGRETGFASEGPFIHLQPIRQKGGKIVHAWACEGDCDPKSIRSNLFTMEWPPKSSRQVRFPEIDRAEFFDLKVARVKIKPGQEALIDELQGILKST